MITRVRKLLTPCGNSSGITGGAVKNSLKSLIGIGIFRLFMYLKATLVINSGVVTSLYSNQSLYASLRKASHVIYGCNLLNVNPSNLAWIICFFIRGYITVTINLC